jgi:hypothetical protein
VFSKTLRHVEHNSRLTQEDTGVEVARLKQQVEGDLGLGGSTLAATIMKLGLIDEYRMFVRPVVLGGGKPYFPHIDRPLNLRLVETRTFPSGVVLLRYERPEGYSPSSLSRECLFYPRARERVVLRPCLPRRGRPSTDARGVVVQSCDRKAPA